MGKLVQLLSKSGFGMYCLFALFSCSSKDGDHDSCLFQELEHVNGKVKRNGVLFTGVAFSPLNDSVVNEIMYSKGEKNEIELLFYKDGKKLSERYFENGKKVGNHVVWWPNGKLRQRGVFENDLHHGIWEEWFPSGQQYRKFHYSKGKEAGIQQMWFQDGRIRSNYFYKKGRRYGLAGKKLCTSKGI